MLDGFFASFVAGALAFSAFFLFWPMVIAFFVIVAYVYDDRWAWKGLFWFVVPLVGIYILFFGLKIPSPWWVIPAFLGSYLLAGLVWSVVRWILSVNLWRSEVSRVMNEASNWQSLADDEKVKRLTKTDDDVRSIIQFKDLSNALDINPKLHNNKGRVTKWIIFWPLSALNYFFDRFLKDLVDAILNRLSGMYDSIARSIMGDMKV